MRGIFALSALYLAYFRAEKRDHFFSQAILQNQTGLRAATSILRHVTDENCAAVYIFTVLTCIYSLASPRKLGDLLVMGESGGAESLALFPRSTLHYGILTARSPVGGLGTNVYSWMAEIAVTGKTGEERLDGRRPARRIATVRRRD